MLNSTPRNRECLEDAILSVYPNPVELEIFVDRALALNLKAITNTGSLASDIYKLIQWASSKGYFERLVEEFCRRNADNPTVNKLQQCLHSEAETDVTSNAGSAFAVASSKSPNFVTSAHSVTSKSVTKSLEVFVSYSHEDEAFKDALKTHLSNLIRQAKITLWQDREIEAGINWAEEIDARLESADIILLLITSSFMASDYCYSKEMMRTIERSQAGTARAISIILKPCDWKGAPFSHLQVLPKNAKPVTTWDNEDSAWLDAVTGIRRVITTLSA